MKKAAIFGLVLVLFAGIGLISCEGPAGPTGPRGEPGERGDKGDSWDTPIPGFPLQSSYEGVPRLIVTTDPEMDDFASLLHMFLYSNEINIIGLIVSDSQWHYMGSPAVVDPITGTTSWASIPGVTDARARSGNRWPGPHDIMHVDLAIQAYRDAYPYLVKHDSNYPPPYKLFNMVYYGHLTGDPTFPGNTHGSNFVASVLLDDVPGKVFVQGWGGLTTVNAALRRIRTTSQFQDGRLATNGSGYLYNKIVDKMVISSYGFQENGGPNLESMYQEAGRYWPDLEYRQISQSTFGYDHYNAIYPADDHLTRWPWTQRIINVGPIGSSYWLTGAQGRSTEYDSSTWLITNWNDPATPEDEGLEQRQGSGGGGRNTTYGGFISEGDSSNWALLVQNGLRGWQDPSWGSYGGRQTPRTHWTTGWGDGTGQLATTPGFPGHIDDMIAAGITDPWEAIGVTAPTNWWSNGRIDRWHTDTDPNELNRDLATGINRRDSATARWIGFWWRQFAARLQWTIKGPAECNHPPVITVHNSVTNNNTLDISAAPGAAITLTATASDPDGNDVTVTWWHYIEAGTYGNYNQPSITSFQYKGITYNPSADAYHDEDLGILLAVNASGSVCTFTVPSDAVSGDTIHIMAEATDNYPADPETNLTTWKRIVVTVN